MAQLTWASGFVVASDPATGAPPRGDKILLPHSALEGIIKASRQLRLDQHLARHVEDLREHRSWRPGRIEDQVGAVEDEVRRLGDDEVLPNPLTFRITNPDNGRSVHAGVREFSAPDGVVVLTPYLRDALGGGKQENEDGRPTRVKIECEELPRGKYVRLRPLEAGYNPDDWRPLLEREFGNKFTTLSKDATIHIADPRGTEFSFLVDRVEPGGSGICVVDTDLEVDIEALDEDQARETMRRIMEASQDGASGGPGGELTIWKPVHGEVRAGEYVDYRVPSWDRTRPLAISLDGTDDPAALELFVTPKSPRQRALPRDSVHVFGDFGFARGRGKTIVIPPDHESMRNCEAILISVHAGGLSDGSTPFDLRVKAAAADEEAMAVDENLPAPSADEEQCQNCFHFVPKRTMMLHENFCRRTYRPCSVCKIAVEIGSERNAPHWHCQDDEASGNSLASRDRHQSVFHEPRPCPCGLFRAKNLPELARHRTTTCREKLILCQFCHLEVPQEGGLGERSAEAILRDLTDHELSEGGKTAECHLCGKRVRLMDMAAHTQIHDMEKAGRPTPEMCRNVNCGRTLYGVGQGGEVLSRSAKGHNPTGCAVCAACYTSLHASVHDPEGKALRRRIERRYLRQMMDGCGKGRCSNEWCRTGRANAGLEQKGRSTRDVMPLVKPLMEQLPEQGGPDYFCVDEESHRQRRMAEMIAAEGAWDLPWCIAAAEASRGALDACRDWLQSWAPRKV